MEGIPEESLAKKIRGSEPDKVENIEENDEKRGSELNRFASSPITKPILFPETWELILRMLSPSDFLSAINSCHQWSHLMHTKKTTTLLPLILPILFQKHYITSKTALPLRQVNKYYKEAVDTCLQRNGLNPTIDFQWRASPMFVGQQHPCDRNTIQQVRPLRTITKSWLTPMGNPFLSGCVTIKIEREEITRLRFLLRKFGHHISSLNLQLPVAVRRSTIMTVSSILNMNLPNLKVLRLEGKLPESAIFYLNNYQQHFPKFDTLVSLNLNSLSISNCENEVKLYLPFLQKYGSQLTVFYGDLRFFEAPEIDVNFLNEQLPKIEMLDATVNVKGLEKLTKVDWKLKGLRLNTAATYQTGSGREGNRFIKILKVINNFSETIKYLHLDFKLYEQELVSGPKMRAQRVDERMEMRLLPNLEQLVTKVPKRNLRRFWDFLETSCPNLKWLHFIVEPQNPSLGVRVRKEKQLGKQAFAVAPKLRKIWFRASGQKVSRMER